MSSKNKFSLQNYPKSFASIDPDSYRLSKYLDLNDKELNKLERKLWIYFKSIATIKSSRKEYKDFEFIGSGWEWSVFKKNSDTIIKVPAGIFGEVNDEKYLKNSENAYKKILLYFPHKFVSKSKFERIDSLNTIEQEYVSGKSDFVISYSENDKELLKNVDEFLKYALIMLDKEQWIPDFNIKRKLRGYSFRVLFDNEKNPKITDFTHYYDVFRLLPKKTTNVVREKTEKIIKLRKFIDNKIYN